jgi:hypothetical protein
LHIQRSEASFVPENSPLLVELFETRRRRQVAITFSEYEESARDERVVEKRQHFFFLLVLEVDEKVAASDEVHLVEWQIGDYVLDSEDHHTPVIIT